MLQVEGLSKSYGDRLLFENVSFSISEGEKVGLIASNGSGKTTLIKILIGEETPDKGEVVSSKGLRITYLPQQIPILEGDSILEACFNPLDKVAQLVGEWRKATEEEDTQRIEALLPQMEHSNAWDYERKAEEILNKLSIPSLSRSIDSLSGGEKKRIALAGVLLTEPDLLILDEPTNHLDLEIIEWLESYLSRSKLMLLLVTHDRYFLDKVCSSFLELNQEGVYHYHLGFESYLEKREERLENEKITQQKVKNLYKKELEWMRTQPQARGTKQKARKDAFYELEKNRTSIHQEEEIVLSPVETYIGKKIFSVDSLSLAFGEKVILNNFEYTFARYDKVGIVGANGVGKTSFLKLLLGEIKADKGSIDIGETVRFGYFSQKALSFSEDKRVIEVITDIADQVKQADGITSISASQLLTRFLFSPDRQYTFVSKLSGGELRRLQLCTVLLQNPNFLILDEPTNDLDLLTLKVLEEYLLEFKGCLLIVSHDRYFMDRVIDHLFIFQGDGVIRDFPGNYTQYRLSKEMENQNLKSLKLDENEELDLKSSYAEQQKIQRKKKRTFKEEQEFLSLEGDIEALEEKIKDIESKMSNGQLSSMDLQEMSQVYQILKEDLENKSMRWLELSEIGS